MKNWADHCSSDDEENADERQEFVREHDDHELHQDAAAELHAEGRGGGDDYHRHDGDDDDHDDDHQHERRQRTFEDFPTEPPFTAFVGNISYSITDPNELGEQLTKVARDRLGLEIKVVHTRLMMERKQQQHGNFRDNSSNDKPAHRGFGYVQVETLDQLKGLMELNDIGAMVAGRRIQVDKANQDSTKGSQNRQQKRNSDIDGSKFRGGRFSKRGSDRQPQGGRGGGEGGGGDQKAPAAPTQRPSLVLKPRTKPVQGDGGEGNSSMSNIFGSGKARDEQAWVAHRDDRRSSQKTSPKSASEEPQEPKKGGGDAPFQQQGDAQRRHSNSKGGDRRPSGGAAGRGRGGGRGGGGDRRASGRGRESHRQKEKKVGRQSGTSGTVPVTTTLPAPKPAEPAEKPVPKVTNTFAALAFDSDSE